MNYFLLLEAGEQRSFGTRVLRILLGPIDRTGPELHVYRQGARLDAEDAQRRFACIFIEVIARDYRVLYNMLKPKIQGCDSLLYGV